MAKAKLKKPKKLIIPPPVVRPVGLAKTTKDLLARLEAEQKKRKEK